MKIAKDPETTETAEMRSAADTVGAPTFGCEPPVEEEHWTWVCELASTHSVLVTVEVTVRYCVFVRVTVPLEVTVVVRGASVMVKTGPFVSTVVVGPGRNDVDVKNLVVVEV